MKTKLSRVGKSSLSMILSLMMIFSTMLIGTITTANATIQEWKLLGGQTDGSLSWEKSKTKFTSNSDKAEFLYDTNNNNNDIYFTLRANEGNKVAVCGADGASGIYSLSAGNETKLSWDESYSAYDNYVGIPDKLKIKFTPTKRYVTFKVYPKGENNYLTVTESDSASGGGATIGAAPTEVLNGTNVMFYLKSYNNTGEDKNLYLTSGDKSIAKEATKLTNSYAYISMKKADLSTYYYLSNNISDWQGNPIKDIQSASGGELFINDDSGTKTNSATTAPTTLSSDTIVKSSASSVTLTTTASSKMAAYDKKNLYIQYYVDDVLVDTGNDIKASTSAQTYTLDVSAYNDGEHTLKTVLTDGAVYYIADTDTFTITSVEQTQLVTPEIEVSNGGVITSGGSVTVSVKNTNAYPTDAGVTFELYKDGTKTSQSGTGSFTVTESGSYTVKAVPTGTVNYKESNLSSSVTVASQETSAFQLCEGSSFTSLGSFTKLGDKYSITFTFTKGIQKLSVYNTVEKKHYLNSNAGTLTVEGDVAKLYKYNNYTDANKNDLAEFNAERDGEYTFEFTEDTTTQRTDDWNLKLVKVPDAVKYKVTPNTTGVDNLGSMTITVHLML